MASKSTLQGHDNNNTFRGVTRLDGDIGELQIEEKTDSEISDDNEILEENVQPQALATIPNSLSSTIIRPDAAPILSDVSITSSENVQFGNNTYFHGPVTIKQVIKKKGIDNPSYEATDNENETSSCRKNAEVSNKQYVLSTWHKMLILIASVSLIAVLCAIAIFIPNNTQGDKPSINVPLESPRIEPSNDPLLIAPNHLRIVSRSDWLAQPVENELDKIRQPIPWVIITHTATEGCYSQSECVYRVRLIQMYHIESKKWFDIGYNFLVGGDGSAYWGRGWDSVGAHTLGYNRYSIAIAFIGTFNNEPPPQKQIEACQKLIKLGVQLGKIKKDYKLFAHRQLSSTLSPGDKLYDILKEWPHFVKEGANLTELLPEGY